ncbi:cell division protein FtsQ/DivIB [uncultured Brachybacterium sp.]|uniref:cell division protein FtsQ/DivIB n=1 Tax=uncultured Brachybacterium sp. TaxID=189680 RepID=UPI00261CA6ED|nr:FtsQ-type POTRA domain-containing protein [uncultured Brachybacterium sp.]
MARRPHAPTPRQGARRPAPAPTPRQSRSVPPLGTSAPAPPARSAPPAPQAHSAPSPTQAPRGRTVGRPDPSALRSSEPAAPAAGPEGGGRVVQASERFRELVAGRPWRRRRRAIIAGVLITVLVLVAAGVTAIFLPALQVQSITVEGAGYVQEQDIRAAASARAEGSVLLLATGAIAEDVAAIPGVESVEAERIWPDGVRVSITEAAPVGLLTKADGTTAVVDAGGQELPPAAGEGASLVPLLVAGGSADPEGAAAAMTDVMAGMPEPLRGAVQKVTASSRSDVMVALALEDGGSKTVVWGDARDAELKAEVVQALLGQPGTIIDVSSPVAPVTR